MTIARKTLGADEPYFEAPVKGWLIVTRNDQPLLYDGRMPMFWSRQVARRHLHPWMIKGGCRVTRAVVAVLRRGAGHPKPSRPVRRQRSQKTRRGDPGGER